MIIWVAVLLAAASAAAAYWLLVITEGVYLGPRVVTCLYDLTAARYDSIKGFDAHAEAICLGQPLADALRDMGCPLVLDIGTGTGRLPLALLGQPGFQGRIIGIDASRRMLTLAAGKLSGYRDRVMMIWRDGSSLPFGDGVFSAVTCLEMLEFTPDPEFQLREAARVLRPGGLLLTSRRRGVDAHLMPGKTHSPAALTSLLEELGMWQIRIEAWQVDYDLVWAQRSGESPPGSCQPIEVLLCASCWQPGLDISPSVLRCPVCGTDYRVADGVILMPRLPDASTRYNRR